MDDDYAKSMGSHNLTEESLAFVDWLKREEVDRFVFLCSHDGSYDRVQSYTSASREIEGLNFMAVICELSMFGYIENVKKKTYCITPKIHEVGESDDFLY